jgi:hypothetical protein
MKVFILTKICFVQLEPYMTEKFLLNGLSLMGEDEVVGIKVCFRNNLVNQEKIYKLNIFIPHGLKESWLSPNRPRQGVFRAHTTGSICFSE